METYLGPQSVKSISQPRYLQDGNIGDNLVILTDRGLGHLSGLQQCVFSHPHQSKVEKVSEVLPEQADFSAPLDFTKVVKEVKLMAQTRGI